ncbi:MAG: AAA family ATPase, partial [Legionellales bacterium]|nr:AAA family ATPase [Legionellales bacterium]
MLMTIIPDQLDRQQALDPSQSYLVQAPAGSGKTGLLTQRFLRLLSQVAQPEHIIALTFTRKAANEMRERVLQTLIAATHAPCPNESHQQTSWQLAHAAMQADQRGQWQLLENPNRLQIMTLDALCAKLTRQMPLLSGLGGQTHVAERPRLYYQQAADQFIHQTQPHDSWYSALADLLLHVENQAYRLENLLVNLLACRDQWLPYLLFTANHQHKRQRLEQGLQHIIDDSLTTLDRALPETVWPELEALFQFARCHSQTAKAPLFAYRDPAMTTTFDHKTWVAIAHWLLTKNNHWRKKVDKNCGFPSPNEHRQQAELFKTMKNRMQQLLAVLPDYPALQQALIHCKQCPPPRYSDQQWRMVDGLITVLPLLCAQLKLVFEQANCVDFIEVAASATQALGALENPSELALRLDGQIHHLLIDEFQDTSIHQFRLLEQLTQDWQADEGRTLFLVGDPMQSIYRFRAAEVSLFLQVKAHGVGQMPLQFIQLQTNFRSQPALIDWVNQTFSQAFPNQSMLDVGAIHYSPARAAQTTAIPPAVHCHAST